MVDLIQKFGRECLTANTDIKDVFRIIPIHPSDYYLLGLIWKVGTIMTNVSLKDRVVAVLFFNHLVLLSKGSWTMPSMPRSCVIFQIFFLRPQKNLITCRNNLAIFFFISMEKKIGVPKKMEKNLKHVRPTLSFMVDSVKMKCRFPLEKTPKINSFQRYKKITCIQS